MRRGHVVGIAGFAVTAQLQAFVAVARTASWVRSSTAKPPASPSDRPSRALSNGRHGALDTSPSELKPNSTLPHRVSTPPTSAASTTPAWISRAACANTFALDEHAVATVTHGPRRPVACCTKPPSECGVCTFGRAMSAGKAPLSRRA